MNNLLLSVLVLSATSIAGKFLFFIAIVMGITFFALPATNKLWEKRDRKQFGRGAIGMALLSLVILLLSIPSDSAISEKKENSGAIDSVVIYHLDTAAYYKRVATLSKKQIDSLISVQIDKDSNYVAFTKIYKAELLKNKITPKQLFAGMDGSVRFESNRFFYWKYFIRLEYAGSYDWHNDDNITFPQMFSIKAVYDIFGNLISLEKEGLHDTSIPLSTQEGKEEYKALLAAQERCYNGLTAYIKEHMNDPESFSLVSQNASTIIDSSYIIVTDKFRGKNAYNATVLSEIVAKCSLYGTVIEIVSNK